MSNAILTVIFNASWHAAILVIIILATSAALRRWIPARFRFALWFIALVRLSAVPVPESRLSLFNILPMPAAPAAVVQAADVPVVEIVLPVAHENAAPVAPAPAHPFRWQSLILPLYLSGACFVLFRIVVSTLVLRRIVGRATPITDQSLLFSLDAARVALRVRRPVGLYSTDLLSSPAIVGFFRPRLLLPAALPPTLSANEFHCIFLHECAHVRRNDILLNYWLALLSAIHWFNPLFWVMQSRLRADRELACDEAVMLHTPAPSLYGHALLKMVESLHVRRPRLAAPATVGILESKSFLKRRIHMIALFKKRPAWLVVPALGVLVIIAGTTLTTAVTYAADKVASAVAPATPADADDPMSAALAMNIAEIHTNEQALDEVIRFLRDTTKLNIVVNWKALENAGVEKNTPITIDLKDVPLRKVLRTILAQTGQPLSFSGEDNVLTISTAEDLGRGGVLRVYNVRDLIAMPTPVQTAVAPVPGEPGGPEARAAVQAEVGYTQAVGSLCEMVKNNVAPDTWRDAGGNLGTISEFKGLLMITTTPENHQKIAEMLATLRAADKQKPKE